MDVNFSVIGDATSALGFVFIALYLLRKFRRRSADRALLFASIFSAIWLGALCAQGLGAEITFPARYTLELLRTGAWITVLYSILGISLSPTSNKTRVGVILSLSIIGLISVMVLVVNIQSMTKITLISGQNLLVLNIMISLIALLLLEQVWRNSALFSRWGIKNLSIAIATIFTYDFVMYSDALLFKHFSGALWDARGAVNLLTTPLIAITLLRRKSQPIGIHVSRQMVFHSTTFVLAGIYLLFVSAGGYYINMFGGTWGEALRVLFVVCSGIFLLLILGSPALRARVMVFISKNFFDYRYDYREEWIRSTSSLQQTETSESLPLRSLKAIAALVNANAGAIWSKDQEGKFVVRDKLNFDEKSFEQIHKDSDLTRYFDDSDWIINLKEYLVDPAKYDFIELPASILKTDQAWLVIPLKLNGELFGFALLAEPFGTLDLNWENYDLLKIVAQQACSYIAQRDSQEKLAESQQFEAVNQTSAFLIHDIKTIIAQLSLLVKNAPKHKNNPEFVDDMIQTTRHSVEKMEHLLGQIRNPNQRERMKVLNLSSMLAAVCHERVNSTPSPTLTLHDENLPIVADPQQLHSVIAHITQNAIDACGRDGSGSVEISTKTSDKFVYVFIQDNGEGMTSDYIRNELFKPFSSTKGLTGMGIGAYQSREYLRKIGGSINVTSEPDIGTCFTLNIPLHREPELQQEDTAFD